jgi:hypothetical protein
MNHEPDPTFAGHLEWQIRTALRRRERFAEPVRPAGLRRLGVAALALVSLCVGAGGVVAAERVQDARARSAAAERRELLLSQARVQEELAQSRLGFVQRELERLQLLADQGVVSSTELASLKSELERSAIECERWRVDREEIELGGREVDASFVAPLVAGRDFVTERLELLARELAVNLAEARAKHDHAALLAERGFVSASELEAHRRELAVADLTLRTQREHIELRSAFVRGLLGAGDAQLQALRLAARARHERQGLQVRFLELELEHALLLARSGNAPAPTRLEMELARAQGELELARIELELVEARLRSQAGELRALGYR